MARDANKRRNASARSVGFAALLPTLFTLASLSRSLPGFATSSPRGTACSFAPFHSHLADEPSRCRTGATARLLAPAASPPSPVCSARSGFTRSFSPVLHSVTPS
ncbi:hypothetical protein MRX96_025864 [Rhipicephalus microplus]